MGTQQGQNYRPDDLYSSVTVITGFTLTIQQYGTRYFVQYEYDSTCAARIWLISFDFLDDDFVRFWFVFVFGIMVRLFFYRFIIII